MAILASVTIVTIVTMSTQQVYAPRECPGCSEFKKLTDLFEKNVIDKSSADQNKIELFRNLVAQFEKNIIESADTIFNEGSINSSDPGNSSFFDSVMKIFPNDETIKVLLEDYRSAVKKILCTTCEDK